MGLIHLAIIIFIIVGGFLLVATILFTICMYMSKKRTSKYTTNHNNNHIDFHSVDTMPIVESELTVERENNLQTDIQMDEAVSPVASIDNIILDEFNGDVIPLDNTTFNSPFERAKNYSINCYAARKSSGGDTPYVKCPDGEDQNMVEQGCFDEIISKETSLFDSYTKLKLVYDSQSEVTNREDSQFQSCWQTCEENIQERSVPLEITEDIDFDCVKDLYDRITTMPNQAIIDTMGCEENEPMPV